MARPVTLFTIQWGDLPLEEKGIFQKVIYCRRWAGLCLQVDRRRNTAIADERGAEGTYGSIDFTKI